MQRLLEVRSPSPDASGGKRRRGAKSLRKNGATAGAALFAAAIGLGLVAACGSVAATSSVSRMTLDEKIGQMFVCQAFGVFMNDQSPAYARLLHQVRDNHLGGIIWSISNVYETAMLNQRLQDEANFPLLMSADLEAGMGMRLVDTTLFPWPMAVAATGDPSLAEREGQFVAQEARAIGINQIFAPVADVNNNPDNPVINTRSYGEDPETVGRFVAAFIRGVQSEGVLATAKHFPGHGDTSTDSHRSLPVLEVDRERLDKIELPPFRAAIDAGVKSIMVAQLSVPILDATPLPPRLANRVNPYVKGEEEVTRTGTIPATVSPKMITGILREELKFDGLVVTDAMDMGGVVDHYDPGEAAIRAIEAGNDMVLMSPDIDAAIRAVKDAVRSGRLSEQRIDESVRRIMEAKSSIPVTVASPEAIFRGVDTAEHRQLAQEIATKAITLVREQSTLPLAREARVVELVVSEFPEIGSPLPDFDRELRTRLETPPTQFVLDARSRADEVDAIINAAISADLVVVGLAVRTRSGSGKINMPDVARVAVERLAAIRPVVAVAFGSPYLLREVPSVQTYLAAYGVQPVMQIAAVQALFGEQPISGHLPVTLPGLYPAGSGIEKDAVEKQ
jgi:beta-N-acetylhexosaminidase